LGGGWGGLWGGRGGFRFEMFEVKGEGKEDGIWGTRRGAKNGPNTTGTKKWGGGGVVVSRCGVESMATSRKKKKRKKRALRNIRLRVKTKNLREAIVLAQDQERGKGKSGY